MRYTPRSAPDSTVFGVAPLRTTLPGVALLLTVLFVAMQPAASEGLNLVERSVFWSVHVGVGLLGILVASFVIRQSTIAAWRPAAAILVTGVIGALFVAPLYLVIEIFLPAPAAEIDDDALDAFAARGPGYAVIAEWIEVTPMFIAAWAAINLPLLFGGGGRGPVGPRGGPGRGSGKREPLLDPAKEKFFARLPEALGRDVVAIASDLHYVHVFTTEGHTMVIGSLRDAALLFGEDGMLVHKSHWVAHKHVVKYVAAEQRAHCLMSTGIKVPVSRRRRAEAKGMYGDRSTVRLASVKS